MLSLMRRAKDMPGIPKSLKTRRVHDNSNDAMVPEYWAMFTLAILRKKSVIGKLIHTDFSADLAKAGDTINTRKPVEFVSYQKGDTDDVTIQDAQSTNIPVVLNQHPHVSFLIRDGEESMSFSDLVSYYLGPAVTALAHDTDARLLGMFSSFLGAQAGAVGGLTSSNYQSYLTELAMRMDVNRCPDAGRNLIVTPTMKRMILQNQTLVGADQRGDAGTALRDASMGRIYGFDHFMCQNQASVLALPDITSSTFLINLAAGYNPGDSVLAVDTGTGALVTGQWIKLGGKAYRITAHTETISDTTSITISPALFDVVANNAPIVAYDPAAVNFVAGYAAGYKGTIVYNGATILPKVGQMVAFAATTPIYTVIAVTSTTITLNRPLEAAIAHSDTINLGPNGEFGFAFHRNAVSFVSRPLAAPKAGAGAIAAVYTDPETGFTMRVVITYLGVKQGHLVTIDFLMGLKQLDANLGAVLLG